MLSEIERVVVKVPKKTIGNVSITTLFIQVIKCTYTGRVTMGNYYVSVVTSSLRLVVAEMK